MKNIKDVVSKIEHKGLPILKVGAKGSGKSTFGLSLANDDCTRKVITLRANNGKGTFSTTHEYVTDYDGIPEGHVLLSGVINKNDEILDKFYTEFICSVFYDFVKNTMVIDLYNGEEINKTIKKAFESRIKLLENKRISEVLEKVKDKFFLSFVDEEVSSDSRSFIMSLMSLYGDTLLESIKFDTNKFDFFLQNFNEKISLKHNNISKIYEGIKDENNKLNDDIINTFKSLGKIFILDESDNKFYIDIDESIVDKEIIYNILNLEDDFNSDFVKDLSIYYKISNEIINKFPKDCYGAFQLNGNVYHVIHFIDTVGLFTETNSVNFERQRIVSLIQSYHCAELLIFINSELGAFEQYSVDCIKEFFVNYNKPLSCYIIYTKFDKLLYSEALKSQTNPLDCNIDSTKYKNILPIACQRLLDTTESFVDISLKKNNLRNFKIVGYPSNTEINSILKEQHFTYYEACIDILNEIAKEFVCMVYYSKKPKVPKDLISIDKVYDFSEIYKNINNCINILSRYNIHSNKTKNIITYWSENGESLPLGLSEECLDDYRLDCKFVNYIKTAVSNQDFYKNIDLQQIISLEVPKDCEKVIYDYLDGHIKLYLKKYFVKNLYRRIEAEYMSNNEKSSSTYAEKLRAFLEILRNKYFYYPNIKFQGELLECFKDSYRDCLESYLNEQCVEAF